MHDRATLTWNYHSLSCIFLLILIVVNVPTSYASSNHHLSHQHLHKSRNSDSNPSGSPNSNSSRRTNITDHGIAADIVARAHAAMAVANKLRLENVQYNTYKFLNSTTINQMTHPAPPLDYNHNTTLQKRNTANATVSSNSTSFSYTIPSELAEAARVLAEASPPAPSASNHAEVAAKIRTKYKRRVNDTNAMPQALIHPDGLFETVSSQMVIGDNETASLGKRETSSFWMANLQQRSYSPYAPPGYTVFRNVKDFGAKGDGVTDDTQAIQRAISEGGRCGADCGSSTIYPAVVYFPGGTYLVSSSLIQYFNTQFIGDPTDIPTILAAASFVGLGVITSDVYVADQVEWYVNQNNFLRSVRNFKIDITRTDADASVCCIHWQVAQGTSLENIEFYMSKKTTQQGIYMENGSGGFLADLTFVGGHFGAYLGNQQFTSSHLVFVNCDVAMQIHWDWAWTMQDIIIESCDAGILIIGGAGGQFSTGQSVGSLVLVDLIIANTPTGIITSLYNENSTSLLLQNTAFFNVQDAVIDDVQQKVLLAGGNVVRKDGWGFGQFSDTTGETFFANAVDIPSMNRTGPLVTHPATEYLGNYLFTRRRPYYTDIGAAQIFDVKAYGAQGDGYADDTAALNSVLALAANLSSIVYFPFGIYLIRDTLKVPSGSRIVGQAWSQIMASGSKFHDAHDPQVAIQVGSPGDVGIVEIQDMLFTVSGPTAGAILVEWNIHESTQGAAGLWDTHIRIGGAIGSQLQKSQCPKLSGSVNPSCVAASLLMHFTPKSSAYLENVWVWVADHDLDVQSQDQIDVYSGRGILVESQGPMWLYGTASEHNVLYQYQFAGAKDILMGMIQTESPYYQVVPKAPAPFPAGTFPSEPTFTDCSADSVTCAVSWAVRIIDSTSIYMLGAGLYSWFSKYSQDCLKTESCQDRGFQIEESSDIWLFNIVTKAIVEMISPTSLEPTYARDNQNGFCSSILAWLRGSEGVTGSRQFAGFSLYQAGSLDSSELTDSCITALTKTIECDAYVRTFNEPQYWGSLGNSTLTDSVCDVSCGSSLKTYYDLVASSCAGFNVTDAEPTKLGGIMWEAWNETCIRDKSTGQYCNDIIDSFSTVESIEDMPKIEMCSYCHVEKLQMMQRSPYSIYDEIFQGELEAVNNVCSLSAPTDIPTSTVLRDPEPAPFCLSGKYYTTVDGDTCSSIAIHQGVPSDGLFTANADLVNCTTIPSGLELCLPLPCEFTYVLQPTDTCTSLSIDNNMRDTQIKSYNSWLSWDCSNIQISTAVLGNVICLSPQGGRYSTNSTQSAYVVPRIASNGYTSKGVLPPSDATVAAGTTQFCGKWHVAAAAETCASICIQEGITSQLFLDVNPSLEASDCTNSLVNQTWYCVGPLYNWNITRTEYTRTYDE